MTDNRDIKKALMLLSKKEAEILEKPDGENKLKNEIFKRVPLKLRCALETAFEKAFETIFLNGRAIIEKTFDKESAALEHEANNFLIDKKPGKKSIKRLSKASKKSNLLNDVFTAATGTGMGLIGMGLPDIPLLTATILRGLYQIATSYGFSYDEKEERIYMLKIIRAALACHDERKEILRELNEPFSEASQESEISLTAKTLSNALLVEKFIQGIPLIGVIGGAVNLNVYKKITALAEIKYKQRYLLGKIAEHK